MAENEMFVTLRSGTDEGCFWFTGSGDQWSRHGVARIRPSPHCGMARTEQRYCQLKAAGARLPVSAGQTAQNAQRGGEARYRIGTFLLSCQAACVSRLLAAHCREAGSRKGTRCGLATCCRQRARSGRRPETGLPALQVVMVQFPALAQEMAAFLQDRL
jgi:hypothetical protein